MAKIVVRYELSKTNQIVAVLLHTEGELFGKYHPVFFRKKCGSNAGVCSDTFCREDKGEDHIHTSEIERTFLTVLEACQWVENIIEEVRNSQASYLQARETLRRILPPDREVIIPE